jgi:hypothetical protein
VPQRENYAKARHLVLSGLTLACISVHVIISGTNNSSANSFLILFFADRRQLVFRRVASKRGRVCRRFQVVPHRRVRRQARGVVLGCARTTHRNECTHLHRPIRCLSVTVKRVVLICRPKLMHRIVKDVAHRDKVDDVGDEATLGARWVDEIGVWEREPHHQRVRPAPRDLLRGYPNFPCAPPWR